MNKPPRFLFPTKITLAAFAVVTACGISAAQAASGSWNVDSGGSWQTSSNWLGGTIAGGANTDVATFNRNIVGNWTITLDSATTTTLNQLVFGDTNTGTAGTWIINPGTPAGSLTLAGSTPTISVGTGAAASISAGLNGTAGLTKSGAGTLTLSGANTLSGAMAVSGGVLNWNGSNSSNMGNLSISGGGSLNIGTGGSLAFTGGNIFLGRGATGHLVVDGGSVSFSNAQDIANRSGTASVTINSGAYTSTSTTYVAQTTTVGGGVARSTTGNFDVSGGSANLATLVLGGNSTNNTVLEVFHANLDVSSGTLTTTNAIQVGRGNRVTATVDISGGTVNTPGFSLLPNANGTADASATINVSGGVVNIGASGISKDNAADVTATYAINLSGGTIAASADWSSSLNMTLSNADGGVTLKAADAGNVARNISLSGILSGDGTLTKSGNGSLTLSADNTFSGGTIVNAGTLVVAATGDLGTGDVEIGAGATLRIGSFASIDDTAGVTFHSSSVFDLNYSGTETIYSLFNATTSLYADAGTYTAGQLNTMFGVSTFTGDGSLYIAVPEPATWMFLGAAGVCFLIGRKRGVKI